MILAKKNSSTDDYGNPPKLPLLIHILHLAMYPDNDEPGERLFLQLQEMLPSLVRHQLPPGCKDYSDYYLSTT